MRRGAVSDYTAVDGTNGGGDTDSGDETPGSDVDEDDLSTSDGSVSDAGSTHHGMCCSSSMLCLLLHLATGFSSREKGNYLSTHLTRMLLSFYVYRRGTSDEPDESADEDEDDVLEQLRKEEEEEEVGEEGEEDEKDEDLEVEEVEKGNEGDDKSDVDEVEEKAEVKEEEKEEAKEDDDKSDDDSDDDDDDDDEEEEDDTRVPSVSAAGPQSAEAPEQPVPALEFSAEWDVAPEVKGDPPPPRWGHSCTSVVDPADGQVSSSAPQPLPSLVLLLLLLLLFAILTAVPSSLHDCNFVVSGHPQDAVLIYGGFGGGEILGDAYLLKRCKGRGRSEGGLVLLWEVTMASGTNKDAKVVSGVPAMNMT